MARYYVWQIPKTNSELATRASFYKLNRASYTVNDAKTAFLNNQYTNTAIIEARSNVHVKSLVANDRLSPLIQTIPGTNLRNVSIGDIIENADTRNHFIVGPSETYDVLNLRQRS